MIPFPIERQCSILSAWKAKTKKWSSSYELKGLLEFGLSEAVFKGGGCSCIWDSKCTRSLCSPLVTSIWRRSKVILSRLFNGDRNRNFEQISHAKGSKMAGLLVFPLYSLVSKTCGLRTKKSWWIFNWWRIKIMWTWIYIVLERRAWWICHPGVRPWEPCIRKTFNHWKIWVRKCRFLTLHYAMLFKKLDSVMLIIFLSGHL